jgi:hypothetical protein
MSHRNCKGRAEPAGSQEPGRQDRSAEMGGPLTGVRVVRDMAAVG